MCVFDFNLMITRTLCGVYYSLHTNNSLNMVFSLICTHQGVALKTWGIKIAFECVFGFDLVITRTLCGAERAFYNIRH